MAYETQSLEAFVTLQRGFDLPSSSRRKGRFPVVAASGIIGKHDEAKVSAPGVTLGRSGSIGSPQFIAQDFWPLNTTLWVKDFKGNDPKFAFYVLRTIDFTSFDAGAAVPTLNRNHLTEIRVPKVAPRQQIAIAALLSDIDQKIDLNNLISKRLEEIAQTIFKSWFIDFDPVHAKSRGEQPEGMDAETAALFPDSFEESELGLIPAGWSYARAESLFHITIGRTPPRKEAEWFCDGKSGVPWISIRDMGTFGVFSGATNEGLTREAVAKFRVPIVPEGSVLFSFKLTVGKVCITDTEVLTNEAIAHFKSKGPDDPSAKYAYLWLKFFDSSSLDSTSSIATATNSSHIKALSFLVPPVELLKAFDSAVGPLFDKIRTLTMQNRTLVEVRDALLPRLISGELEIPEELLVG